MATPKKPEIFKFLNRKFGIKLQRIFDKDMVNKAVHVYRELVGKLNGQTTSANDIMGKDAAKLRSSISEEHIGKLVLFFYDPKFKDDPVKLPYYDRVPLIIPLAIYDDGFLGINFHYLHPLLRAQLLDMILSDNDYEFLKSPDKIKYNEFAKRQLNMTYQKLQSVCQSGLYAPCVKRYLWNHCRSRFYLVDPDDWLKILPLPLERFERATSTQVWQRSAQKVFK